MQTIVISTANNGRAVALHQVMDGATAWSYVFDKRTIIYKTKKEAQEVFKNRPGFGKGNKYVVLNKQQLKMVELIKESEDDPYILLNAFLSIK